MTKEQAIKILQGAIKKPNTKDGYLGQAIDMAIKALEQNTVSEETYIAEYTARKQAEYELWKIKEQQPCEDCVSRQAVKEGMIKYGFHAPDMTVTEFVEDELLSVTPKPPTSDDCVSRKAVKEGMIKYGFHAPDMTVTEFIEDELPLATPKIATREDCVSLGVYKQVTRERDIAIEQLKELGYGFGEKIRTSDDCVSRADLLAQINESWETIETKIDFVNIVKALSPVTPTQRWIPIERREPTQEEKTYYMDTHGEELSFVLTNQMPSNGQEVLVTVGNTVSQDTFFEEFYNFEGWDISDVDAWMPLPQPYEEKRGSEE